MHLKKTSAACTAAVAYRRKNDAGMSLFISGVSAFIHLHRFRPVGAGLLRSQEPRSSFTALGGSGLMAGTVAAVVAQALTGNG
ncbi:MAG: hypothetical protein RBS84_09505 [Kiritimatiellia bacterium]|nr:hypothetical protein [Kiritimatiellia bacterium]